jgi:plasmid maintenance system killer protein
MESRRVEREYVDEELRRLATDPEFQPAGWNDREIREFHRLVQCVRAAYVETDLRNMRVLRIESDHSGDPSRAGATLSSGRVIDLTFKNSGSHGVVVFGAY